MVKKRGLGKSLGALLSYTNASPQHLTETASSPDEIFLPIPVDQIQRGKYQPRRDIDTHALEELANSIRAQGIIQPLIVRPIGNKYEIIAGERRWRAAQLANLPEVPAIVRHIPDEAAMAMALIENIQREDLSPIEEAIALDRLIQEFAMTHQQVAEAVGKSRASVSNLLRLLALPEEVKELLERGLLEMGHARTLITLPGPVQLETAQRITARALSVRETEDLVRRLQSPAKSQANAKGAAYQDQDIVGLQENLSNQLKLRVAIHCNAKGRGKLVIHYRSLAELNGILSQFRD